MRNHKKHTSNTIILHMRFTTICSLKTYMWNRLIIVKIHSQWFIAILTLSIHQAHQKVYIYKLSIYISTCSLILLYVVHCFIFKICLYSYFTHIIVIIIIFNYKA